MNKVREIERIRKDWEIIFSDCIIRRKNKGLLSRIKDKFLRTKYSVNALYSFVQAELSTSRGIAYPTAIKSDNIKTAKSYPTKYQLMNNWKIPQEDLSFLIEGPLISEDGSQVLVEYSSKFKTYIKKNLNNCIVGVIASLIAAFIFYWIMKMIENK